MIHSDSREDFEGRLDEAFAEYLDRLDRGEPVDPLEFAGEYPDCADALREEIEDDRFARTLAEFSLDDERSRARPPLEKPGAETMSRASHATPAGDAAPAQDWPAAHRVLGDYELLEPLARGGMGIVYKARQRSLNRIVALKVIADGEFATPSAVTRFRSEAEAAARLKHPNIVAIHEIGEQDGRCYFSMDYIHGRSLAEVLQDGPLPPRQAARYAVGIARAVEYAHQRGLLHRDVKPSNVLIDEQNQPLLTDFGLVRSLEGDGELTQTGEIVGTAGYMSPEQSLPGRTPLGPQADVYSVGALLYALLVGRPPFQADSPLDTLLQVRETEPAPPRRLNPKVPRDLETICLMCLEKSPSRRYSSAGALADDLRRYLSGFPITARPLSRLEQTWRWCGRHRAAATAAGTAIVSLAALVAGLALHAAHVDRLNRELGDSNTELLQSKRELATALTETRSARDRALDSERRTQELLYAADMRSASRALRERDYREVLRLLEHHVPGPGEIDRRGLEWHLVKRLTSAPHVVLEGHQGDVYAVKYSPDGRWLVSAGEDETARLYDGKTLEIHRVIRPGHGVIFGVAFDPSGDTLACCCEDGSVFLVHTQTGEHLQTIAAHPSKAYDAAWTPDGKALVSSGNEEWVRLWNAATGTALGKLGPHESRKAVRRLSMSVDGKLLAAVCNSRTKVWDLTTREIVHEFADSKRSTSVAFDPEGRWLSIGSLTNRAHLLRAVDFQRPPTASVHEDSVEAVAFSPDGAWGADVDRGGMISVWPVSLARSGQPAIEPDAADRAGPRPRRWLGHDGRVLTVAFSSDSRQVATAGQDDVVKVWRMETLHQPRVLENLRVGDARFLTDETLVTYYENMFHEWNLGAGTSKSWPHGGPASAIAVSGSRFAAGSKYGTVRVWDCLSHEQLCRIDAPELGEVLALVFSPDGSRLFAQTLFGLAVFDSATMTKLDVVPDIRCNSFAVAPDGRVLALAPKGRDEIEIWDLETRQKRRTLAGHSAVVKCLAFGPQGRLLASGSEDRLIKLWDAATGELRFEFSGHRSRVTDVVFSPDGRSLLSSGWDGTLRIWSTNLGRELVTLGAPRTPETPSVPRFRVALSPDGRTLLHVNDGTAALYAVGAGEP